MNSINEENLERKLLTIKELCLEYLTQIRSGSPIEEDEVEYMISMILREVE